MRYHLILSLCCLSLCPFLNSQSVLPEFGSYSGAEINLKECSFDKNAEAIVLLDEAVADHDDEYRLITRRRIRIKIFHQREVDRGNIRIHFYSRDKFEYITDIRGLTYNQEGAGPRESVLDKKSIFTEKEDNFYSSIKFAMPNVRPGSIIEYEYVSYMKHYGGLSSWVFQNEIPTLKSCFRLTILPNAEFQYNVQKKTSYPITIKPSPDDGKIYFEMNNIPGLKYEPYMDAKNDYLQKVEFQLAKYVGRYGNQTKINQTWKDAAYELLTEREFGGAIKKNLSGMDEIRSIVTKETSDSGKLAAIYNYVRHHITWNGYNSKYAIDGLKSIWEKRVGTAGEINLLLINLLQTFDIEVYPLLVAERYFGKIDTTYPFLDRFNKVVAYARAGGRTFILDATQQFSPPGLTPYPLLNTIAFIVDRKEYNLIKILSRSNSYENTIDINATVDNKGLLKGTAKIISKSYSKQLRSEALKEDSKKFIKDLLEEPALGTTIDRHRFDAIDDDGKMLEENIDFHTELNESGGFIFIPYSFFTGLAKNPFTAEERFTNVNFGYPYNIKLQATIQLPEKAKIDKIPAERTVISADGLIFAFRRLSIENNTLTVTILFRQTVTLIPSDQYADLKSIYTQIAELVNEAVIIKIGE